jgi:hypothetical protein
MSNVYHRYAEASRRNSTPLQVSRRTISKMDREEPRRNFEHDESPPCDESVTLVPGDETSKNARVELPERSRNGQSSMETEERYQQQRAAAPGQIEFK